LGDLPAKNTAKLQEKIKLKRALKQKILSDTWSVSVAVRFAKLRPITHVLTVSKLADYKPI